MGYVTGGFAILGYLFFTAIAYIMYPSAYTPTANWLSDLGNYSRNPAGALFYDVGVFLTGALIAAFAISYLAWRKELRRRGQVLLSIGVVSGVAAGVSLASTGFFPLPTPVHGLIGMSFQINMADLIVFSTVALLRHPKFIRPIAYFAFVSVIADLNFSVLNNTPIFEWLDIGLFLVYAALMAFNFRKSFSLRQ
ncbi:MAG: hypothetical protein OK438_01030 [Thaumarchaeota archaeon]|nr:hypothetical protein [Nitrososphaerota archaeon]